MIHHLNCASMCPRGGSLLGGSGGPWAAVPLIAHCLLVETSDGLVLVDTGFGTADCASPKRLGQPFRAVIRPQCHEHETAIRQIEAMGRDPRELRHIAVTHLDVDHAGGISDFPEADVHVHAPELAMAMHPTLRERSRYRKPHWAHGPRWVEHAAGGDSWFGFDSVRVLPGVEPEIALVPLVGHSKGHAAIAVRTPDGWVMHCGDAYFHHTEIETPPTPPVGLRAFQNIVGYDQKARRHNQERLRELARTHGAEVQIICAHDSVYMP